nr:Serum albumin [Hymenolepis microstoma]
MLFNQFRNHRFLNISALLASGEFIIDDNGYLVAIGNGTRYRLPSGPPEGRASDSYELQPILPGKNQQLADSAVDWLDLTTPATAITTTHNNIPLYISSQTTAGFALFITLKPSNTSVQGSIFFTGYISVCVKVQQQSLHIQELILLVVIPLIGDFVVVILFFCCCRRLPVRVCLLSTLMPIINLTSFTSTLLKNLPNFVLLPLILNPIVICILYRITMPRGETRVPENEVMLLSKERSPLHQTCPNMSPSISSDVYFPQTILAITPHRCNHANGIPPIMAPNVCPHFQHIVAHSQNCTLERRSCNEIIQPAEIHRDVLSTLSETSCIATNPATAAVMAATAAAFEASKNSHRVWSPMVTSTSSATLPLTHPHLTGVSSQNPTLLLHTPSSGVVTAAASLDRRTLLPIFIAANENSEANNGRMN